MSLEESLGSWTVSVSMEGGQRGQKDKSTVKGEQARLFNLASQAS